MGKATGRRGEKNGMENSTPEEVKYHYSREERLKKLKRSAAGERKPLFFRKRRIRNIFIIFIDLILIYVVFYILTRPASVHVIIAESGISYEVNVTGMKGKKLLIALTIKNEKDEELQLSGSIPVTLAIKPREGKALEYRKSIDRDTVLLPGETTSVMFLFNLDELPRSADLELYYGFTETPVFSRYVRF